VQPAAGVLIGVNMVAYSWLMARVGLLVAFWFLFRAGGTWVSVAFYVNGLIRGDTAYQPVLDAGQPCL